MNRLSTVVLSIALVACVAALGPVSAAAAAKRPVARWDTVPDQIINDTFNVGVCAFHVDGVKVEFRVNGGLVHTADDPTYNERTDVWEHWFALDPSAYADGPLSVDARAIPLDPGAPSYDLPTQTLYADSGGTLLPGTVKWVDSVGGNDVTGTGTEGNPYETIARAVANTPAGGTINLKAGSYSCDALGGGSSRSYWTTIQAAPGVARDDVEVSGGRPGTQRLKWTKVTFWTNYTGGYHTILVGENGTQSVWLDDCKAYNKAGRWAASAITFGNRYVSYVTGGITTEMADGPGGSIIRNHTLYRITSDAFTGSSRLVVNCECIDIDPGTTGAHPDFHQSYSPAPNWCEDVILYNVSGYKCLSQGLFGHRLRNSAFVNLPFERTTNTVMYSQYSEEMVNVLFLHINIINQTWLWRGTGDGAYDADEVKVYNSIFGSMSLYEDASDAGLEIDRCHFSGSNSMGTNKTLGDPQYVDHHDPLIDPSDRDYHLLGTSPAYGTGRYLQCVPADIDGNPFNPAGRNRGAYAMDWLVTMPLEVLSWQVTSDLGGGEPRTTMTDGAVCPALGGVAAIRAVMNLPVDPATLAGDKVTLSGQAAGDISDQIMSVSLDDGGQTIVILLFDVLDDAARYTVTLDSSIGPVAGNPLTGDRDLQFGCLVGDVDSSGDVTAADMSEIRSRAGTAATGADARYDIDASGDITAADMRAVRAQLGNALP